MDLKYFDEVPGTEPGNWEAYNPSKYFIWQDLLLGLFDVYVKGLPLVQHYTQLAKKYRLHQQDKQWGFLFEVYQSLAMVLAKKRILAYASMTTINQGIGTH